MFRTFFTVLVFVLVTLLSLVSASSMELPDRDKLQVEQVVDRVIIRYLPTLTSDRIQILISRIDKLQMTSRLTQKTAYLLTYLRDSLLELLQPINIPTAVLPTTTPYLNMQSANPFISNISYFRGPKTILAGRESQILAKYELSALYEDILIKDFKITSPNNLDDVIESIQIYNNNGTKISQGSPVGNQVLFSNQDILLKQGNHYRYMTINPRKVGYNAGSTTSLSYQLSLQITRADGVVSTEPVSVTTTNQLGDTITIRPYLFTTAELTKSRNGNTTDTTLHNGTTRLGILRLGIDAGNNTTSNNQGLKVILSEISLSLGNNIVSSLNSMTLRNINGGTSINGSIANGKVTFSLAGMPVGERTLESLSEQGFLITLDTSLSPSVSESLTLSMDTLSISFTSNEDTTLYSDLGLGNGFVSSISVKD